MLGTEGISDNDSNEHATETRVNVRGKIFDARVNPFPVNEPRKEVNGACVLDLNVFVVSEGMRRGS